jgi:hypothetical protein
MRTRTRALALATTVALAASPGVALAAPGGTHPPKPHPPKHHKSGQTTPHAYGRYCRGESKQHVAGGRSAFSLCVGAMAKLAHGTTTNPATACATLSHTHVAGTKGTPYSTCVAGARKLLKDTNSGA